MTAYNASLLRLAREQEGLTQKGLAERLNVQQAVLSKYENGAIVPPENMQLKIASALNYPMAFFLQDDGEIPSGLAFHRKRSSLLASVRLRIEAEVRARSLDAIKLFRRDNRRSNIITREGRSAADMAKAIRSHWNVAPGPIADLTSLLEQNGIIVLQFDFLTDKLDGFFMPLPDGIVAIALNDNPAFSPDRRRHTLAHEFGHALLEHCSEFPDKEREKEAEAFAAELLTPADCIKAELQPPLTINRLLALKTRWKVSMGSLLYRAHSLGTIKDSTYRRTWMFLSSQGYRKREPDCGIPEEHPKLLSELMRRFVQVTPDALETLHLTAERFRVRYPQINMEGQSSMTPTVS